MVLCVTNGITCCKKKKTKENITQNHENGIILPENLFTCCFDVNEQASNGNSVDNFLVFYQSTKKKTRETTLRDKLPLRFFLYLSKNYFHSA